MSVWAPTDFLVRLEDGIVSSPKDTILPVVAANMCGKIDKTEVISMCK